MLELLMTRQDDVDRKVLANCAGLSTLVLDELHTYRGRQGADVAMLVRRIRQKLAPKGLQCIGTSATMSSDDRPEAAVANVASKLFDCDIPPSRVITERLERRTDPKLHADNIRHRLAQAISAPLDEGASMSSWHLIPSPSGSRPCSASVPARRMACRMAPGSGRHPNL